MWLLASDKASKPARRNGRTNAGDPPNESVTGSWIVGSPFVDSVISRLPTVRSALFNSRDMGASAAAASGTPRTSMMSPVIMRVVAPGRLRTGSTAPTRAATTVGPTRSTGTTAMAPGSRSTARSVSTTRRPR